MVSISTIISDFWVYRGDNSQIYKIYATENGYSCPLINTGGITPGFNCYLRNRCIGPYGRSGKAIRGFPGHSTRLGRQLPEINIEIRYIVQVYIFYYKNLAEYNSTPGLLESPADNFSVK